MSLHVGPTHSSMSEAKLQLAKTVGKRLFWAGEATYVPEYGTTFGAYASGIEVGEEIQQSMMS